MGERGEELRVQRPVGAGVEVSVTRGERGAATRSFRRASS